MGLHGRSSSQRRRATLVSLLISTSCEKSLPDKVEPGECENQIWVGAVFGYEVGGEGEMRDGTNLKAATTR